MRTRSSSWLLLSLIVLAGLLAAELRFEVGTSSARLTAGRGRAPPADSPSPLFTLAERESFSETLTRPLFMPDRQPPAAPAAESPLPAPRAARPNANRYVLSAVIIVDDERVALLTDTATGGSSRVREGDSLAGWRVEEIREDGAVLNNGDTREELVLRTFGPPAPAPRSSKRRAGSRSERPPGNDPKTLPNRPQRPKRGLRKTLQIPRTSSD